MDFEVGDVVRLKSGGPRMTVQKVGDFVGEPYVQCSWFVVVGKNQKLENGSFHPKTLEKDDESGGAIGIQF